MTDTDLTAIFSDEEAERVCLGTMMRSTSALDYAAGKMQRQDFTIQEHREVFSALLTVSRDMEVPSVADVAEALHNRQTYHLAGGHMMLVKIDASAGLPANIETYCRRVKEQRGFEKLAKLGDEIQRTALSKPDDFDVMVDGFRARLSDLAVHRSKHVHTPDQVVDAKWLEIFHQESKEVSDGKSLPQNGVPTGYYDLDALIDCLENGHLIILGARSGVGKTALAMNIHRVCFRQSGGLREHGDEQRGVDAAPAL